MDITIRPITDKDSLAVMEMMTVFYASPAVMTNGSAEIFENDIKTCLSNSPYLEGYVFTAESTTVGYGMLAKSFSTEFGKNCIWIEDIYIKEDYRGFGVAGKFFDFIKQKYDGYIFRLEVEKENRHAVHVYEKNGFSELCYTEMIKL